MPAKKEHLSSPGQRAMKIPAAVVGGYCLSITLHLTLATVFPGAAMEILFSATYSLFLVWIALMVPAFYFRRGWIVLTGYFLVSLLLLLIVYLVKY